MAKAVIFITPMISETTEQSYTFLRNLKPEELNALGGVILEFGEECASYIDTIKLLKEKLTQITGVLNGKEEN